MRSFSPFESTRARNTPITPSPPISRRSQPGVGLGFPAEQTGEGSRDSHLGLGRQKRAGKGGRVG